MMNMVVVHIAGGSVGVVAWIGGVGCRVFVWGWRKGEKLVVGIFSQKRKSSLFFVFL
jgi:hypothetical protein